MSIADVHHRAPVGAAWQRLFACLVCSMIFSPVPLKGSSEASCLLCRLYAAANLFLHRVTVINPRRVDGGNSVLPSSVRSRPTEHQIDQICIPDLLSTFCFWESGHRLNEMSVDFRCDCSRFPRLQITYTTPIADYVILPIWRASHLGRSAKF
jgi:hypothetical protein